MACFHPLKGFPIGHTETGKVKYKITPYEQEFAMNSKREPVTEFTLIPCGQCIGCRLDRSREWANRCLLELQYHDSAFFVTLTYDEEHVPRRMYSDPDTGEVFESLSLCKRDFQLFMKRLRKAFPDDKIRFFACGEYGGKTQRPHYHAILFGLHLDDLKAYKRNELNEWYYTSEKFQKCWSKDGKPIGWAVVANVSWETCAYVSRYVTKKLTGDLKQFYEFHNIEPEFSDMSRKPGIARQYFEDHPEVYDYEFINISTEKGGRKFHPPSYFDRLYDLEEPAVMSDIKAKRRKAAQDLTDMKLKETNLSYLEYLQVEEDALKDKFKKLRRRLEENA